MKGGDLILEKMRGLKSMNICIRVTPSELDTINNNINEFGIDNPTHYLRTLLLREHIVQTDTTDIRNITVALNRIGNNINQITKKYHQTGIISNLDIDSINENFEEVKREIDEKIIKKVKPNP